MNKIILDTNFLLIPGQFKIDIFSEIERICDFKYNLFILDKSIGELNKIIQEQKGKAKSAAKLALTFINSGKLGIINTETNNKDVDAIIVELSEKEKIIVATQDQLLKRQLKSKAKIITMRQKKYLIMV